MANKQELELIIKKLKEEVRLLRKEVDADAGAVKVDLPIDGVCIFMEGKDYFVCDVKVNNEADIVEIKEKKKLEFLHTASMEAQKRMAYLFNGLKA